jgi:sugar lactone lactonase YvrE/Tol biopolymer transport system component
MRPRGRRGGTPAATRRRARPLALEALEDRTLLDATLQAITLASVAPPSVAAAAGSSADASVSADGRYVAYESTATNLVADQASGAITSNVFLFDRLNQTTTLVSQDAANPKAGGNADSFSAVLSSNGHFLYYLSRATDLVSGVSDPAGTENLYVYDTTAKTTRLVTSHAGNPSQAADGDTGLLDPSRSTGAPFAVSADGSRIAYVSAAADLVSGMTGLRGPSHANVFLTDLSTPTPTTWLISAQADSPSAGAGGWSPALSGDGQWLAFVSDGTDLVPNQAEQTPPGAADASAVFLTDIRSAPPTTQLVSRKYGTTSTVAGAVSDTPVIDADGGVVAFRSDAADLVAQQFAGSPPGNVFVYERAYDTVGLVSHAPGELTVGTGGTPFTPDSRGAAPLALSADGRSLAYQSQAAGLVGAAPQPGSPPPSNVFVWQLSGVSPGFAVDGTNALVSGAGGSPFSPANGSSFAPALSADGGTVAFVSAATNLVPGQATTGSARNVFTASTAAVAGGAGLPPTLVSAADSTTRVAANADSSGGAAPQAADPNLYAGSIGLSSDGGVLTFQSTATDLSTDVYKANNGTDVFAFDRNAGLSLVSRAATAVVTAGGDSYVASVSADDRYTAFVSDAFDLVPGQQNNHFGLNVFLRFDATDTTSTVTLVNHVPPPGAPTATGDSGIPQPPFTPDPAAGHPVPPPPDPTLMPKVSGDGSAVVFVSNDHDLVSGQQSPGGFHNVFRYRVADGSVTLVSHLPNDLTASGAYDSDSPAVSFYGEFVALVSDGGVYLYDANVPQALTLIAASGSSPSISDDGRYVAYVSQGNAFLYDRLAGTTGTSTLISHDAGSARGDLLALTVPPAAVTAGQAFALTATVQDAFGKTDTTFNGPVTLGLGPGSPAGAGLGGSVMAQAAGGVAHFEDVLLTVAGAGYALTASAGGVTSALTPAFAVVPAAASKLAFLPPPSLSLLNQPISPTVAVAIEDPFGNVVNTSASVTVALGSNPFGAVLAGTTVVTAVQGVATFSGLTVSTQPPVGQFLPPPYTLTLTAQSSGFPAITSPPFAVTDAVAGETITTVAGDGNAGVGGDGGPATDAELTLPEDVAVDAASDLYLNDSHNNLVRKVSASGVITTVAGDGGRGFTGDNVPATATALDVPRGLAVDSAGDLFIADRENNRVREVSPDGTITTVAGNGGYGYGGDGGPATDAELARPNGMALDAGGDLFIADQDNNRVREVSPSGVITTVAGNGSPDFSGDGGPATAAALSSPSAVAVDTAGDLFIADQDNNRVREVSPSGVITTVAGNGSPDFSGDGGPATAAGLYQAFSVAVDAAGNLYLADFGHQRVREVSPSGVITTVAGAGSPGFDGDGGPATAAHVQAMGVAVDGAGDLYLADYYVHRVRKVSPTADVLAVVTQPPSSVAAGSPFRVSVAVRDAGGNVVAGFNGPVSVRPGTGSPAGAVLHGPTTVTAQNGIATFDLSLTQAAFYTLSFSAPGVTSDTSSAFAVTPVAVHALAFAQQPVNAVAGHTITPPPTVEFVDQYGNVATDVFAPVTLALANNSTGAFLGGTVNGFAFFGTASFTDLTVDRAGTYSLVASSPGLAPLASQPFSITSTPAGLTITTVAGDGNAGVGGDGGPATDAELTLPEDVAVDAAGDLYINDSRDNLVREVSPSGVITTVAGDGGRGFTGDNVPATATALDVPRGLAVDSAGDLFIADRENNRVRAVSPSGIITTVAGAGQVLGAFAGDGRPATAAELAVPNGVAVDAAGDLFIADQGNHRIREVSPSGIITTVAGDGTQGFSGDGGPATDAALASPSAVAVDAAGDLFIADQDNNRIREVSPSGIITTVAGNGSPAFSGDGGPATAAGISQAVSIAVDAAGNLFIADFGHQRVREVAPSGIITTVAGDGTYGSSGDGGPATAASVQPMGVAADSAGNLYLADFYSNVIRKVINPATRLVITSSPTTTIPASTPFTVAVTVEDANGNAVSGYTGTVQLALGPGSPAGAALGGTTTVVIDPDNGVATFSDLTIAEQGSGYTLVASAAGLTGATTAPFNVGGASATLLAVPSLPPTITAGAPFTIQVAAQDTFGNTDPTYTDPVALTLPDGTVRSTAAVRGVATFSGLVLGQPGKDVTLTATAPGLSGVTTAPFNVGAATATRLVVSQPSGVKAGVPFAFTVTAEDDTGNVATGFNGPVTIGPGQGPAGATLGGNRQVNAVNGVARFTLSVTPAGSGYTLTASDPLGVLPAAATGPFAVAATPELLAISPPVAATAGSPFTVTVTAEDANGNPDPSFRGTVTLAVGPGSPPDTFLGGPTSAAAVNGTATFSGLLLTRAGSYTLTATTANLIGGFSVPFAVNPGPAAGLALTPPSTATAGVPFSATVTVEDALGNVVPSFNGPVNIRLGANPSGATLGGTTPVNAVNGVATFRLTLDRARSGYTLSADAGGLPAVTSQPFDVGGVTATQLGVTPPAFAVARVPFTVTVAAQDAGGNLVPSFNGPVTLGLGPDSPAGAALGGALVAQAVNGLATFTGLTLATPGTGYALVATADALSGAGPQSLAVLAGGDGASSDPVLSADGNAVAYVSAADNLVAGQAPSGFTNVFLYTVATAGNALVSAVPGSPTTGGDNNSDSPAIDLDGHFVAYRSDADNLLLEQDGARGNVFLSGGGSTALVSAASGSPHTGAGQSFAPAIDGDGSKVVYLSSADDLVPNEAPGTTVNVYLYAAVLAESLLVTGQFGSATVPGNGDASNALISRHSFPLLSSAATNLVHGAGAHSNGYRNTLINTSLALQGGILHSGTGAGALVGTFSTASAFAGQFQPQIVYSLTGGFGDDTSFTASGGSLLTAATISQASYTIQVRTDVGLGPIYGLDTLVIPVGAAVPVTPVTPPPPSGGISARLVAVRVGKKKKATRQMLEVFDAAGALKEAFAAPFQGPGYRNVQVTVHGNQVIVTARKGHKKVSRTYSA